MQGPFTYEALPPSDIRFVPLKQTREFNAADLLQVRRTPTLMAAAQLVGAGLVSYALVQPQ